MPPGPDEENIREPSNFEPKLKVLRRLESERIFARANGILQSVACSRAPSGVKGKNRSGYLNVAHAHQSGR